MQNSNIISHDVNANEYSTASMTITPHIMDIDEDHRPRYLVFTKVTFDIHFG